MSIADTSNASMSTLGKELNLACMNVSGNP